MREAVKQVKSGSSEDLNAMKLASALIHRSPERVVDDRIFLPDGEKEKLEHKEVHDKVMLYVPDGCKFAYYNYWKMLEDGRSLHVRLLTSFEKPFSSECDGLEGANKLEITLTSSEANPIGLTVHCSFHNSGKIGDYSYVRQSDGPNVWVHYLLPSNEERGLFHIGAFKTLVDRTLSPSSSEVELSVVEATQLKENVECLASEALTVLQGTSNKITVLFEQNL